MVKKAMILLCPLISSLLLCFRLLLSAVFTTGNRVVETLMRIRGQQLEVSWGEPHEHMHMNKKKYWNLSHTTKTCWHIDIQYMTFPSHPKNLFFLHFFHERNVWCFPPTSTDAAHGDNLCQHVIMCCWEFNTSVNALVHLVEQLEAVRLLVVALWTCPFLHSFVPPVFVSLWHLFPSCETNCSHHVTLITKLSFLPVSLHWCKVGGFYDQAS